MKQTRSILSYASLEFYKTKALKKDKDIFECFLSSENINTTKADFFQKLKTMDERILAKN